MKTNDAGLVRSLALSAFAAIMVQVLAMMQFSVIASAQITAGQALPSPGPSFLTAPIALPPAVANLKLRSLRTGQSRTSINAPAAASLLGRADSGTLWVTEFGCGTYGLATHFTAIFDIAVFDLSALSAGFGNESLLIAGAFPDGRPGVSVIVRNKSDSVRLAVHHLLPLPAHVGEIFLRVGYRDGSVFVFEAASRTILSFVDSNSDLIPDSRLPEIYQFPADRLSVLQCMRGPSPNMAWNPTPFLVLETEGDKQSVQALYEEGGVLKFGRVRKNVAPELAKWELRATPAVGHERLFFSALNNDVCEIQVKGISDPVYSVWVAAYDYGSTQTSGVSPLGARPLRSGDLIRVVSGGQVRIEADVSEDSLPLIWSWGQLSGVYLGSPLILKGENLNNIVEVALHWTPPLDSVDQERQESRSFVLDSVAQTLTIQGGNPFSTGSLRLLFRRSGVSGWYIQKIITR